MKEDRLTADFFVGNISVWLGNGDARGFRAARQSGATGGSMSVVIGDVNGDGKADVVTAETMGWAVGVRLGERRRHLQVLPPI